MSENVLVPRKAFPVMIYDKIYWVYDIPGKEHEGFNDTIKTWWLFYSDNVLDYIPPADSEYFRPYSVGIKRLCWDISFKQRNSTKEKWGDTQFNNRISCEISCNGRVVYVFGTFDMPFAFAKAQYLMTMLCEHPYNFLEPEKEKGRKIWWYALPATIRVSSHPGEIGIVPDYSTMSKEEWWRLYKERKDPPSDKEEEEMEAEETFDEEGRDYINWGDALSDGHIKWFRK